MSVLEKVWYIEYAGNREGPYDFEDLLEDSRITPGTLAWKEGMPDWKPIREIPELADLFKEKEEVQEEEDEEASPPILDDEIALDMNRDPGFPFWIILAALAMFYILYMIY